MEQRKEDCNMQAETPITENKKESEMKSDDDKDKDDWVVVAGKGKRAKVKSTERSRKGKKSESSNTSETQRKILRDFSILPENIFSTITDVELEMVFPPPKKAAVFDEGSGERAVEEMEENTPVDSTNVEMKEQEVSTAEPKLITVRTFAEVAIAGVKISEEAAASSQRSVTEKGGPCFSTSGDARVDFFSQVMEQASAETTKELLANSWQQHPLHTLKLIAVLRDIRGGKGIRFQYQACLHWLYENHPKTLYENLGHLLTFGYWKDALQMLVVIAFDGLVHPYLRYDDVGKGSNKARRPGKRRLTDNTNNKAEYPPYDLEEKETYNKAIVQYYKSDKSIVWTSEKVQQMKLKYARERFQTDLKYRVFHIRIAQLFAQQLKADLALLNDAGIKDKGKKISLVAKWAPSLEKHFDNYTLIATSVALELTRLLGESQAHILKVKSVPVAVYLSRKHYHKEYCVRLRKYLELPEVAISAGKWNEVNYKRVASKCMKRNTKFFVQYDADRFQAFLKKPENKVAGATLKPIELINQTMRLKLNSPELERLVIERQWDSLVEDIKSKGKSLLQNAVAVCDVSGSMSGQPIEAAIGLTLITLHMCTEPWNTVCITFHESPQMHHLPKELSLIEKVESLRRMDWGGTTDIQKVFHLILKMGLTNKLAQEQMPQMLLIFTDMEFDEASPGTTKTNFEEAKEAFAENGYELPAIIFWNLRASSSATPVQVNEHGAMLLSGFSAQQLAYVMEQKEMSKKEKVTPLQLVLDVVEKKRYKDLTVYD